ncbi:MAG: UvrD-helicase domain-containing protein [Candidatus Eremiobacteraeota bacterium]|nr:UvrD-helicase domain-containing protein [Candidatus Eremiobacteraeota bacterium]MBV8365227.1 UvrD-helicase domain-containing protein [Candidatus Eremiobacteraeota bacterium]
MDPLEQLNDEQRAAASQTEGAVLIFAGAGSGKTRVLTHRVAHLLATERAPAHRILAVTFTNKAAGELRTRLHALVGENAHGLWVGTFHSIGVRVLRRSGDAVGVAPNFVIYDEADQRTLLKEILHDLNIDERNYHPGAVLRHISRAKERLMDPLAYADSADGQLSPVVASLYSEYQRRLSQANALDFDDLIMRTIALLEHQQGAQWRERFEYVLVDEYQDVNEAQYRMVRALSRGSGNICVVGDDDQSIYAFRGADHRIILRFERDFPGATTFRLERNYRSTSPVLKAANALVEHNTQRHRKKLWTSREGGKAVRVYAATTERDEARFVVDTIHTGVTDEGRSLSDHVVLYRTNAQSRAFEEALLVAGLPYRVVGGVGFYARAEVKDALAYLRYIMNREDGVSLRRIINAPRRGIGQATLNAIADEGARRGLSFAQAMRDADLIAAVAPKKSKDLAAFLRDIEAFSVIAQDQGPAAALLSVLEDTGYVKELRDEDTVESRSRIENLQELIGVAREYEEREGPDLAGFLANISLVSDLDAMDKGGSAVTLMTLHMAKGLEFPVVFLAGLEEGVFPHNRALVDPNEIEEERRLCYVGVTRAIDELYLSYAKRRTTFGSAYLHPPSRFLNEMTGLEFLNAPPVSPVGTGGTWEEVAAPPPIERTLELAVGDSVTHPKFGAGKVLEVRGAGGDAFVTVDFGAVGRKSIMLNYAKLEKV